MKTMVKIFFLMAFVSLIVGCKKLIISGETVTAPFKADFVGNYMEGSGPNTSCGDCDFEKGYCWSLIINEGEGTGTHLGKFTHHFEFCCEVVSGVYPGGYMDAYFTAENGDILRVACAGKVIEGRAEDHPDYVTSYFRDPFVILGGTGRFEGATGSGMTDDYNSNLDPYSHHHWTGTITLVKGKK